MTNSDEDVSYFVHGGGNQSRRKEEETSANKCGKAYCTADYTYGIVVKKKKRIKNLGYYMHGKLTLQDFPARYKLK